MFISRNFKEDENAVYLGNGVKLLKKSGQIDLGKQILPIRNIVKTLYTKDGLKKQIQTINPKSPINVIFMESYRMFLVVENSVYNSLYFQLFVLENYDKNLYQPVALTPMIKIYKLKISLIFFNSFSFYMDLKYFL